MQFPTEYYNNDDKLELSSSSYSQADMTPVGVNLPFDNPYLEAAFQALRDNSWVLEEPSIDLGQGSMAEALAQPNASSYERSDSYTTDGQYHPFDQSSHPGVHWPAAPQDLNVPALDYANAPPTRYPVQSGSYTAWERHVSQHNLHTPHIGSEKSNSNDSKPSVKQVVQELGSSPGSNYNHPSQYPSHGYRQDEWVLPYPHSVNPRYTPPSLVATPPPAQAAYDIQQATSPCSPIHLSDASSPSLSSDIESPHPANSPPSSRSSKKRIPITRRTLELTEKYFPKPDRLCLLCSHHGTSVKYTRPKRRMEHLASAHIIQTVRGIKDYKKFYRKLVKQNCPMLINSEETFAYARELVNGLQCKYCKKDTSVALRDENIDKHMLMHGKLKEHRRKREANRLKKLVNQKEWHSLSDKILYNLPLEAAN